MIGGQPVAEPYAHFLDALDPPYSSRKIGAEEPAVRRFVRKTAHRSETKVDGARCEIAGLQMHPVPDDHRFAKRQSQLRTVPVYEFINGMAIAALSVGARQVLRTEDFAPRNLEVTELLLQEDAFAYELTFVSLPVASTPQVHPASIAIRQPASE